MNTLFPEYRPELVSSFHKTINENFMLAYLTGYWTDSNNNSWTFGFGEKDGDPYFQYSAMLIGDFFSAYPWAIK